MPVYRDKLEPYEGRRVTVRGTVVEKGSWKEGDAVRREVGCVRINNPEIDKQVMCEYVWLMNVSEWGEIRLNEQVEVDAVVTRYQDRSNRKNWCLRTPSRPIWLRDGVPSLKIPGVPIVQEKPKEKIAKPIVPFQRPPQPPKQETAMSNENGKPEKPKKRFVQPTMSQFYELCETIKTHREAIHEKMTFTQAHAKLQASVKFPLSENSIRTALSTVGVTTKRKEQKSNAVQGYGSRKAIATCLKAINALADELKTQVDFVFPEPLAKELADLAEKVGLARESA